MPLAIIIAWVLSMNGVTVPAEVSAALGAIVGVAVVCLHDVVTALGKVGLTVLKRRLGVR